MEACTRKNLRNSLRRPGPNRRDSGPGAVVRVRLSLAVALTAALLFLPAAIERTASALSQEQTSNDLLLRPSALTERAPETFRANFDTSAGRFMVEVHRAWAPHGADRFYNLVKVGFYDGNRFYRVTPLMAVWGLNGDPAVARAWLGARIPDDPTHVHSNTKGTVAFFQANKRTTQTFVNLEDNSGTLDIQIVPFGEVVSGMDQVQKLYAGYGESPPNGKGPDMNLVYEQGDAYLVREFPKLDYIKKATIVTP
jgi:peptidyl-prolyl cis-trans isomerase A (cyclophilin A)